MTDSSQEKLEQLATNTIRMLAVDAIVIPCASR